MNKQKPPDDLDKHLKSIYTLATRLPWIAVAIILVVMFITFIQAYISSI